MATKKLEFSSPRLLSQLYCSREDNLNQIERVFEVKLTARDNWIQIEGSRKSIEQTEELFDLLKLARDQGLHITDADFSHILDLVSKGKTEEVRVTYDTPVKLKLGKASVVPRTINQKYYLDFIKETDITFGIGPAGTGKTYLAVAMAVDAFLRNEVDRIILTRPAVEAGEALGFLPGDLQEKILPYLRPLYDALFEMIGPVEVQKLIEKELIEIAPLAYMRGRTLSRAFVILDEAQNTTPEQMMMFLTRLGNRSKMVVTGDITQIDLPHEKVSGLKQAIRVLANVTKVKIFYFENKDIVRHPIVQDIIEAYDQFHSATRQIRPKH